MASVTMAQALNEALRYKMTQDPKVICLGEDVGKLGGVFRITDKLQQEFGEWRSIDTPLAESGIVGTSIGMAMYGLKPVAEMQFDGFTYPAFEQIISHAAKYRFRSMGRSRRPCAWTWFSPCSTAPTAKTAPCRACSKWPGCPMWGPACWRRRWAWIRTCRSGFSAKRGCP